MMMMMMVMAEILMGLLMPASDGPLFRETLKNLENYLVNFRPIIKQYFRKTDAYLKSSTEANLNRKSYVDTLGQLKKFLISNNANYDKELNQLINELIERLNYEIEFYDNYNRILVKNLQSTVKKFIKHNGEEFEDLFNKQFNIQRKKYAEKNKEYYNWLNKYLASDRSLKSKLPLIGNSGAGNSNNSNSVDIRETIDGNNLNEENANNDEEASIVTNSQSNSKRLSFASKRNSLNGGSSNGVERILTSGTTTTTNNNNNNNNSSNNGTSNGNGLVSNSNSDANKDVKFLKKKRSFELARFDYYNYLVDYKNGDFIENLKQSMLKFLSELDLLALNNKNRVSNKVNAAALQQLETKIHTVENQWAMLKKNRSLKRGAIAQATNNGDLTAALARLQVRDTVLGDGDGNGVGIRSGITAHGRSGTVSGGDNTAAAVVTGAAAAGSAAYHRHQPSSANGKAPGTPNLAANDTFTGNGTSNEPDSIDQHEGILWTYGGGNRHGWHKQWVVLKDGYLREYLDWKLGKLLRGDPIDMRFGCIKQSGSTNDRRFCFEVITAHNTHRLFQAASAQERDAWIASLNRSLHLSLSSGANGGDIGATNTGTNYIDNTGIINNTASTSTSTDYAGQNSRKASLRTFSSLKNQTSTPNSDTTSATKSSSLKNFISGTTASSTTRNQSISAQSSAHNSPFLSSSSPPGSSSSDFNNTLVPNITSITNNNNNNTNSSSTMFSRSSRSIKKSNVTNKSHGNPANGNNNITGGKAASDINNITNNSNNNNQQNNYDPNTYHNTLSINQINSNYATTHHNHNQHDNDQEEINYLEIVRHSHNSNLFCADCGSTKSVDWISISLLVVVCIDCSGVHRSLGSHLSKIRSLTLDISIFTPEIVKLLRSVNNQYSNSYWETKLNNNSNGTTQTTGVGKSKNDLVNPSSSASERSSFIINKYKEKAYVEEDPKANSHLIYGIHSNNIQMILKALACGGNPNMVVIKGKEKEIESSLLEYALTHYSGPVANPVFEIAELLLLNGASCGTQVMDNLNLIEPAKRFWQAKIDRSLGISSSSGPGMSMSSTGNHIINNNDIGSNSINSRGHKNATPINSIVSYSNAQEGFSAFDGFSNSNDSSHVTNGISSFKKDKKRKNNSNQAVYESHRGSYGGDSSGKGNGNTSFSGSIGGNGGGNNNSSKKNFHSQIPLFSFSRSSKKKQ